MAIFLMQRTIKNINLIKQIASRLGNILFLYQIKHNYTQQMMQLLCHSLQERTCSQRVSTMSGYNMATYLKTATDDHLPLCNEST